MVLSSAALADADALDPEPRSSSWRQVSPGVLRTFSWALAGVGAALVLLAQWSPVAYALESALLGLPLGTLTPGGYLGPVLLTGPAGGYWVAAAALAGTVGVLLAPRTVYSATALAVLPYLSVLLVGQHQLAWLLGLGLVTAIIALRSPLAGALPGLLALAAIWLVLPFVFSFDRWGGYTLWSVGQCAAATAILAAAYLAAAGLGVWVRGRRSAREALLAERRAAVVEAQAAERAAISRDLHDVVAHHVSLVAVRAESAPYQHDLEPAAREVLADIASDARAALGELRHVLSVLQRSEVTELAPQPLADDVDELVAVAVAAGQDVVVTGEWGEVPPAVGYMLYRATQEVLTNARRHAPGARVHLVREATAGAVTLRASSAGGARGASGEVRPGRGLIGMRERVESVGGELEVALLAGVFTLAVSIPLDAEQQEEDE
ncbi:hypothetical protein C8046_13825 [Serinibacter arcticus]|uniref:histidine kinase n=1 Tax=Serinibacter arcticus TaxID=1655435 RepID=A0A2U1ZXB6_9MICO|nr:histidine kinase [Serinibacter arcticus]PWD51562.1 hypothetical protein C8046_13825 [Serinibacter arcticus]